MARQLREALNLFTLMCRVGKLKSTLETHCERLVFYLVIIYTFLFSYFLMYLPRKSEEDIAMMLKAQQASGAVQNSANYPSMTSGTNNTALNQGSQPVSGVGSIERVGSIPSGSVGSRPGISGGQQLRS